MPKNSAVLSKDAVMRVISVTSSLLPPLGSKLICLSFGWYSIICLFLGETIYPARCGPVGEEEPLHSCVPQTKETQVLPTTWKKTYSTSVSLNLRISRSPVLVAEYLNGERHWQSLHNFSCDEVRFDKGIYTTWYRCTSLHNAHLCHYKYVVHACLWPSDPPIVTTWILQVGAWMDYYRTHSGREFMDQFKMHYTDYASIQVYADQTEAVKSSLWNL